jgi:ribonuclease HI
MELQAALGALEALKEPVSVSLHTDSAYLARAFNDGWIDNWQKNGWRTASKKPVENRDLWEALLIQTSKHKVKWIKVKGHADDAMNNRVDELAVAAMKQRK